MSQIIIESKLLIKNKFKLGLVLMAIFSILLSLNSFAISSILYDSNINDIGNKIEVSKKSYKLSDNALNNVSEYYTSLFGLTNLKNFYNQLKNNTSIYFYEIIDQPTYLRLFEKNESSKFNNFGPSYEYGSIDNIITINDSLYFPLKNISVDMNAYNLFNFNVSYGRNLENDDVFYSESQKVPVILGYSYIDLFKVGDIIKVNHLQLDLEFEVVGVLNKDFCLPLGDELVNLNTYIITPSLEFPHSPKSENEKFY
ncbi:MAG: ABC transporter permease [Erysipelotrichaceae bacterium]|nr:ABC transporter permease [Erysipelotrichaceae bacterium]